MRSLLFFCCLFIWGLLPLSGQSNGGYRIEVAIDNFDGDTLLLGYYFGRSQYLQDTAVLQKGKFVFEGTDTLHKGVYLLVIPPDNRFIHVLIDQEQPRFSMSVDLEKIVSTAKFKGSPENEVYYEYLHALEVRRPIADSLKKLIVTDSLNKEKYQKEVERLDKEVMKLQDDLKAKHPSSLTTLLVWANREVPLPPFADLNEEDRKLKQFEHYRAHYFDHFDLTDPRTMRTGVMHPKIDYFLSKLSYQLPDSQSVAMGYLLEKMKSNKEAFQYYLVYFLNESARSKRMGMDAVYVYLIDNYYSKGLAPWTEKEQLDKLIAQAEAARPTLIGKIAPDLTFIKEDGQPVSIHSFTSDFTVLYFWDPECGHCKKMTPFVVDFYNEYKNKGVEMLAICTKTGQDISSCWSTIKERGMDIWVNAADQYLRNRYKSIYDVKTTPQIFILDKDKKIIVKKIGGEDLKPVMEEILKNASQSALK